MSGVGNLNLFGAFVVSALFFVGLCVDLGVMLGSVGAENRLSILGICVGMVAGDSLIYGASGLFRCAGAVFGDRFYPGGFFTCGRFTADGEFFAVPGADFGGGAGD